MELFFQFDGNIYNLAPISPICPGKMVSRNLSRAELIIVTIVAKVLGATDNCGATFWLAGGSEILEKDY